MLSLLVSLSHTSLLSERSILLLSISHHSALTDVLNGLLGHSSLNRKHVSPFCIFFLAQLKRMLMVLRGLSCIYRDIFKFNTANVLEIS